MSHENSASPRRITAKAHTMLAAYLLWAFLLWPHVIWPFALGPVLWSFDFISLTAMTVIYSAIGNILPLMVYLLLRKQRPKAVLPPAPLGKKNALYIVVIEAAFMLVIVFLLLGHFGTIFDGMYIEPFEPLNIVESLVIPIIAFGLLTATFEELWYRGPMYSEYVRHGVSFWKIALVGGLLFGIVHSGTFQVTYTFVSGVIMVVMLHYTRSIWAPILAHVAANIMFVLFNPFNWINDYYVLHHVIGTWVLILGIAALVMLPIGIWCLRRLVLDNPREKEPPAKETKLFTIGYWVLIGAMVALGVIFSI